MDRFWYQHVNFAALFFLRRVARVLIIFSLLLMCALAHEACAGLLLHLIRADIQLSVSLPYLARAPRLTLVASFGMNLDLFYNFMLFYLFSFDSLYYKHVCNHSINSLAIQVYEVYAMF